jgi:hypothetical protein
MNEGIAGSSDPMRISGLYLAFRFDKYADFLTLDSRFFLCLLSESSEF